MASVFLRLENLLVARPALERSIWTAEQLARSGCFGLIALLDPPRLGRTAVRLTRSCEHGTCAMLLWVTEGDSRVPAKLRIQLLGRRQQQILINLPHINTEVWLEPPP